MTCTIERERERERGRGRGRGREGGREREREKESERENKFHGVWLSPQQEGLMVDREGVRERNHSKLWVIRAVYITTITH